MYPLNINKHNFKNTVKQSFSKATVGLKYAFKLTSTLLFINIHTQHRKNSSFVIFVLLMADTIFGSTYMQQNI